MKLPTNRLARGLLATVSCFLVVAHAATPERPFSDRSPWNARPTKFVLGSDQVPKSKYFPTVAEGDFSVRVFTARATDPPITVLGKPGQPGIWIADAEAMAPQIVIPRWPKDVVPAVGGDGHADVVDVESNRIHSFYQLRLENGQWRAAQYTWSALDGRGWGEPGHYFQGSRAAGVPTMGGLIRSAEVNDGLPAYRHALAMSMTFNALAADPAYVYPATAADINAAKLNHGMFPEGSLIMLPADFDAASIRTPALQKIVRTLQSYGAYVVDQNEGTPFAIYVEIGSNFSLMGGKWDNDIAQELDRIRAGLRRVVSATEWVDANGVRFTPPQNLNLLSMRGPWYTPDPGSAGTFDTWEQAVVFQDNGRKTVQVNASGRNVPTIHWATPKPGVPYRLKVTASKGATLQLELVDAGDRKAYSSGMLGNGASVDFKWPASGLKATVTIASGPEGGGKVSGSLAAVDHAP